MEENQNIEVTPFSIVLFVTLANWAVFLFVLLAMWAYMDTRNMRKELEYMRHFESAISSSALQSIMCNGEPYN